MKPEDLKPPFPKDQRVIVIEDRVWYIPRTTDSSFVFPGWNHSSLFGNLNPVCIEYCSGNGAWIAAQALAHPEINWVAIEKKFARVRKIWSKIKNFKLNNLLVICGEALHSTESFFPSDGLAHIFINFPDPWPKKRHAKHRLIQIPFIQELARVMQAEKVITFVTDDEDYSQQAIELFLAHASFKSHYPQPFFSTEEDQYGTSYFEELWRSKGKTIRYHRFIKQ